MALVSCTKEITANNEGEKGINADGTRTLTVSFASKATKTTLKEDGVTPVWAEGDKIFLADGNATDTYTVTAGQAGQKTITITTNLQGTISAVYPADAAIEVENIITGVKVGAVQDSTFGSANICMAEEETEGVLSFENKTAVFEVKVPAHTTQLVVTSLGEIDGTTGLRGETIRPINTEGADDAAKQKITVDVTDSNDSTTCYVSVLVDETNPVLLTNLNFDAVASGTDGTQGGFSPKYLKDVKKVAEPYALKVAAGTIYSLPGEALHPYVNVNGNKWATCNIGATQPSEPGYYFQFAGLEGFTEADMNKTNKYMGSMDVSIFFDGYGPYSDPTFPTAYSKYKADVDDTEDGRIIELVDDAASYWWGGAWRMPCKSDLTDTWGSPISGFDENDSYVNKDDVFFYKHKYIGTTNMISGELVDTNGHLFRLAQVNIQPSGSYSWALCVDQIKLGQESLYFKSVNRAAGVPVRPFSK